MELGSKRSAVSVMGRTEYTPMPWGVEKGYHRHRTVRTDMEERALGGHGRLVSMCAWRMVEKGTRKGGETEEGSLAGGQKPA